MFSRVDAGAVRAFNAVFTIKEQPLWIGQVASDTHVTHTGTETQMQLDFLALHMLCQDFICIIIHT